MYKRKVQVVGGSTFIVSLPKSWAEQFNLKEGEEVIIEEQSDGTLRIVPSNLPSVRAEQLSSSITIKCDEKDAIIARTIISHYIAGKKEIHIKIEDIACKQKVLNQLEKLKKKVLGLEILEELSDEIVLGAVLDSRFSDINSVILKMAKTIQTMMADVIAGLRSSNLSILEDVASRDDYIDRLYLYSIRYLTTYSLSFSQDYRLRPSLLPHYALICKSLERMGDHVSAISKNLALALSSKVLSTEEIIKIEEVLSYLKTLEEDIASLLSNYSYSKLVSTTISAFVILEKESSIRAEIGIRSVQHSYITESIRRIIAYSIDILESLLDIDIIESPNDLVATLKSKDSF